MSETLKVAVIDQDSPNKEEKLDAIDEDMIEFHKFFTDRLKQSPASRMETAYLKTYLVYKVLGKEEMIR
jgi:hypothetical protein